MRALKYLGIAFVVAGTMAIGPTRLPAQEEAPPPPEPQAADADQEKRSAEQEAANRRQALLLLEQAELALEQGETGRALELASEARDLYPQSRSIAGLVRQLRQERGRRVPLSAAVKAKARLAAALNRSRILIEERRYREATDLLEGVQEASNLFPDPTSVSLYRNEAKRSLARARASLRLQELGSAEDTAAAAPSETEAGTPGVQAPPAEFIPPPENYDRLTEIPTLEAPRWYTDLKAKLATPMNVDYVGMPLGQVLEEIETTTGVNVNVDQPVRDARLELRSGIDLRITGASAESVLALATRLSGTEYVLLPDEVVVTTRDKAIKFVARLPEVLADRWLAVRTLFPDRFAEAVAPPVVAEEERQEQEIVLPAYLRSGKALTEEIARLLEQSSES